MERMDTQEKLDRLEINYDYLKEENSDPKLWELKKGTMVAVGENKHIMEFLGIDGMYARRKPAYGKVVIMGHANQKVSELGEILHHNK